MVSDMLFGSVRREDGGLYPVLRGNSIFSLKMDLFLFAVKLEPKTSDLGENGIEKLNF